MTQQVCDWCQAVIPAGKESGYVDIGKNRSGLRELSERGTDMCEDCITAIRNLKRTRSAGGRGLVNFMGWRVTADGEEVGFYKYADEMLDAFGSLLGETDGVIRVVPEYGEEESE